MICEWTMGIETVGKLYKYINGIFQKSEIRYLDLSLKTIFCEFDINYEKKI